MSFVEKALKAFPGHVVEKGLLQDAFFHRVPRFVVEYLLAKAGGGPEAIAKVRRLLEERYLGPGNQEWIKDQLLRKGRFVLIDRLEVRVDLATASYLARLPSLGEYTADVDPSLPEQYPGVLYGLWGTLELAYEAGTGRVRIRQFVPFQASLVSLDPFLKGRTLFSEEEWTDFLLASVGVNPELLAPRQKLLYLARMAPLVEPNLHVMELGPRQTGKTYLLRNLSPESHVISGGRVSPAVLYYDLRDRKPGLIPTYQVLVFDEIAHTAWEDPSILSILKDYMESGQFSRGGRTLTAEASLVFLGNADRPEVPVTRVLPQGLRGDTAFLDRIHGILPGHEFPKISPELLYTSPGLVVDYLSAALKKLRPLGFDPDLDLPRGLTQRDVRAVRKWVSAFLKLLYPNRDWTADRARALSELALELRERVYCEMTHYNREVFPPRGPCPPKREEAPGGVPWEELYDLLDEAYIPLFRALQEAGLPPPTEGPEDVPTLEGQMVQSLARWGDKRLFPRGSRGEGLEVDPDTPVEAVRAFLGL
ncbi:BREX system Lon protease-like protein BrxL [Thermus scotoductus]|uniref:BREX system Lon protease-like protein BrxL n=1 Tax=Thermus scotoductus TaxID=37636 RepID=UPI0005712AFB|nr:BREX system Lon protease-like protein BrxL [Thermus scotoductus]